MKIVKLSCDYVPVGKESDLKNDLVKTLNSSSLSLDEIELKWSKNNKYTTDDVRSVVGELLNTFISFLANGRANEEEVREEDVDAKELEIGIGIEAEHTTNKEVAKRIALDHLAEIKDYYTRLVKMEKEAKGEG